jgi:O-antigen ligase
VRRILGYEAALTKNPNDLALMLNLILPLSVALVFIARHATTRVALLLIVGLETLSIVVTFSRAGFLSLSTIAASYVWTMRRRPERVWAYGAAVLLLAALPLVPHEYVARLSTIVDLDADATGSAQQRFVQQVAAINFVVAHPIIGAGLGMNILAMHEELGDWLAVHNVYLQYATDLGLPGLVLFLLLLAASLRSARWVRRHAADLPERRDLFYLATAIHTSLLAFAVSAFFSPVAYHFQFYYLAGLAVAVRAVAARAAAPPGPPSRPPGTSWSAA